MQAVTIFGSNSGNKRELLKKAIRQLSSAGHIIASSSLYETAPWGFEAKENFLNRVVIFETDLPPLAFLKSCLETEKQLGRTRLPNGPRYASRPIDIDLLFYDSLILDTPELILPHPRMAERNFVLVPLSEIIPDFLHPQLHKTIRQLSAECSDTLPVKKIT